MLVESSYVHRGGEGTPMFSRRGRSTCVDYLVFSERENNVPSTFAQEKAMESGL